MASVHLKGITGKRVVVTAAASGIGRTIARRFHSVGARVHVSDIDADALTGFAAEDPGIGATVADVADRVAIADFFEEALAVLGGLDILVGNAGVSGPAAPVEEIGDSE